MIGIIACQSLYCELESLAPEATIRYVPPELAEFPVNVPNETAIADAVQSHVDELDALDLERIVTLYPNGNGELAGVSATKTPLYVSTIDDAISLFIHEVEPWTMGEPKEYGTYYLSRGWIDAGVDAYKLYTSYLDEHESLCDRFERAETRHDDLHVTWYQGDRYQRALERNPVPSRDLADRFFAKVMGFYERVKLVETGAPLYDVHYEYADSFRSFVDELVTVRGDCCGSSDERSTSSRHVASDPDTTGTDSADGANSATGTDSADDTDGTGSPNGCEPVTLETIEGDDSLLRTILETDSPATAPPLVDVYLPGMTVK